MPKQISAQITEATQRQIDALKAQGYGSTTIIIRTAIDRMFHQETRTMNNAKIEWTEYLVGIIKPDELKHDENRAKLAAKQAADREHDLMMLGYNQAMLDADKYPDGMTREGVQKIVDDLRAKLGR